MSSEIGRRHDGNIDRILELHPAAKDAASKKKLENELLGHTPLRIARMRKKLEKNQLQQ